MFGEIALEREDANTNAHACLAPLPAATGKHLLGRKRAGGDPNHWLTEIS